MDDRDDPTQPSAEDARLASLERRLDAVDGAGDGQVAGKGDGGYRLGNRVLAELLGGMIGGALFGWLIDRLFGTAPWGLLALLFAGIVVAFRNIIRLTGARPKR